MSLEITGTLRDHPRSLGLVTARYRYSTDKRIMYKANLKGQNNNAIWKFEISLLKRDKKKIITEVTRKNMRG
jgi:hypothetical protein